MKSTLLTKEQVRTVLSSCKIYDFAYPPKVGVDYYIATPADRWEAQGWKGAKLSRVPGKSTSSKPLYEIEFIN